RRVVLVLLPTLAQPAFAPLNTLGLSPTPAAPAGATAAAAGAVYPSVIQSIIEAKLVGLGKVLMRIGPTPWISALGVVGFLWVCWRRPLAVFLLPLLVLAVLGMKMGIRFTMFGGPMVALGLGVPLSWGVRRLPETWAGRARLEPALQVLLGVLLLIPLAVRYADEPPTPVLSKPHAEALLELADKAPAGAEVWTWWDWGYATQFYARRMTPVDGGLHDGRHMYPVALALTTTSLRQANNLIRYAAAQGYDPAKAWDGMSGAAVRDLLDGLKNDTLETPGIPTQYLVAAWANLGISEWITYFGSWDLVRGEGVRGRAERLSRAFRLDPRYGAVVFEDGSPSVAVSSVDLLDGGSYKHRDFFTNLSGPHLVLNKERREAFLLDDTVYYSTMVQLLVVDPSDPSVRRNFELVVDRSPYVRIYRVTGS
ncbi:MAG: hypothetical protein AB7D57_13205, partial [Desulfovibrionaceae bacterium]